MTKTPYRRRREAKTDYEARLAFLKSERPRLVVRKTNRYITAQIVESDAAQDKVIFSVNSKELLKKGWPKEKSGSLKSLQAAYLTGFMLGKKLKGKLESVVLDIGLNRNVSGSRIYALVKGAVDAGVDILHAPEIFPKEEKIKSKITEVIKEKL